MDEQTEQEAAQLRAATSEAIVDTAQARAVLHSASQDIESTPEQVAKAAQKYRQLERVAHEAIGHEIDFHYVTTLHALKEARDETAPANPR